MCFDAALEGIMGDRYAGRSPMVSYLASLGALERGEVATPRMATFRKLAEALGVDPTELVE